MDPHPPPPVAPPDALADAARASPPTRRLPTKILLGLVVLATLIHLALRAAGLAEPGALFYLGVAALFAVISSLAWEVVERRRGGVLAWVCFPLFWLLGCGQLPFLVLAVYPPLQESLVARGRVEAYVVRDVDGPRLELWFPEPMDTSSATNLRFNSLPVPLSYYEAHRDTFRWIGRHTLSIALDPLRQKLGLQEIRRVAINMEISSRPFHYATQERVSGQEIAVRRD